MYLVRAVWVPSRARTSINMPSPEAYPISDIRYPRVRDMGTTPGLSSNDPTPTTRGPVYRTLFENARSLSHPPPCLSFSSSAWSSERWTNNRDLKAHVSESNPDRSPSGVFFLHCVEGIKSEWEEKLFRIMDNSGSSDVKQYREIKRPQMRIK